MDNLKLTVSEFTQFNTVNNSSQIKTRFQNDKQDYTIYIARQDQQSC